MRGKMRVWKSSAPDKKEQKSFLEPTQAVPEQPLEFPGDFFSTDSASAPLQWVTGRFVEHLHLNIAVYVAPDQCSAALPAGAPWRLSKGRYSTSAESEINALCAVILEAS